MSIYSSFASASKSEKITKSFDPGVAAFLADLASNQVRTTYGAIGQLLGLTGPVNGQMNRIMAVVESLPLEQQFVACQSAGGYHVKALSKWASAAPVGFQSFPVIKAEQVKAAYEAFLEQGKEEEV